MLLIARRYLLSRKSHSVVNIIAWVSILSLLLPVAAVIVLLSIFNGFGVMIADMESAIEGDLTVSRRQGKLFEMSEIDRRGVAECRGVEAMSFVTEQMLLMEHRGESAVVTLRGVDDEYHNVVEIEESVNIGEFDLSDGKIVVGHSLASKLGMRSLYDTHIELFALKTGRLQSIIPASSYTSATATLAGVMLLDQESEDRYAFSSQSVVNHLLGREGVASRVVIAVEKGYDVESVRSAVEGVVGDEYRVQLRSELNPAIHQIVRYEKMGVLLICSFVMILASFSLLGALTMLILEKQGDITTLRSIGFSRPAIARIFTLEGLLIGGVAIVVGVILGVGVSLVQQHFGIVELPSRSMVVTPYPVELHWGDVAGVVIIASAITLSITLLVVRRVLWSKLNAKI